MKLIHLSDLHLGKRLNEYSMLEEQQYILTEILNIIDAEKPDAVIVAGDVYDKAVPSAEAVELFDDFLVRLSARRVKAFIISGNHDSPERIAFAGRIMDASGIYLSPVYDGRIKPISMEDEFGSVNFYLLPFVKPVHVKRALQDENIDDYTSAMRAAVAAMDIDEEQRNVLVTHQFVTGAERTGSEELSVGGTDNVDASVFDAFDYVALGHIHGAQNVGCERIRYCGTPLKYSFSEAAHRKSVTLVELGEKGQLFVRTLPLEPLRDMHEIKGCFAELSAREFYDSGSFKDCYLHVTLTDENDIPDAVGKLRVIYPYLMRLDYDNTRTRRNMEISAPEETESKSPLELFSELYELQNNQPMSAEQRDFVAELIKKVWEEQA